MSTYRQLTYMVLDELKLVSDDSHFTKEHIMSLLNWYRLFILKQRYSDIKKQIPDSKALNLAGCSLSSVLYYVSDGIPVIATGGNGETVLIVGYDAQNTILMDPTTGTIYKKGMNDSTAWFAEHGNEFVTYVKKSE